MSRPPLAGGLRSGLAALAFVLAIATPAQAAEPPGRIVGGVPTPNASAPWQVALAFNDAFYAGGQRERFACGGTLIAPRIVLTAAHCVYDRPEPGGFNAADRFEVYTGKTNLSGGEGQVIDVSGVRYLAYGAGGVPVLEARSGEDQGPNLYNPTTYSWDLAVLTLHAPSSATPILLAGADEAATWSAGRPALISGWGSVAPTDPSQLPNTMHSAAISMAADGDCAQVWPDLFSSLDRVCAGAPEGGRGTCQGDSGGPLAVPVEVGSATGARLVGIASYGPVTCGTPGAPSMFVRVAADPIRAALAGLGTGVVGSGARPFEPPQVTIAKHPRRKSSRRKAKFVFTANEPVLYECNLDNRGWKGCPSEFVKRVGRGRHRFKVRAFDALGQVDPDPAHFRWRVKRAHRRR